MSEATMSAIMLTIRRTRTRRDILKLLIILLLFGLFVLLAKEFLWDGEGISGNQVGAGLTFCLFLWWMLFNFFHQRRYVHVNTAGARYRVYLDTGGYVYTDGYKPMATDQGVFAISTEGLGLLLYDGGYRAFSREDIRAVVIETGHWFLIPHTLVKVMSNLDRPDMIADIPGYQPRSLNKTLAALETYGYGDLVSRIDAREGSIDSILTRLSTIKRQNGLQQPLSSAPGHSCESAERPMSEATMPEIMQAVKRHRRNSIILALMLSSLFAIAMYISIPAICGTFSFDTSDSGAVWGIFIFFFLLFLAILPRKKHVFLRVNKGRVKISLDANGHLHYEGYSPFVRSNGALVVCAAGLGINIYSGQHMAFPHEKIRAVVVEKGRWLLFSYTLIRVTLKPEEPNNAPIVILYQPRSLKKILAALKEYGYGDKITHIDPREVV